jgi:hypothetical protein
LGLVFIVLMSFFRRVSLDGKKAWDSAWEPIQPTLQAKPAPSTYVRRGITGLFTWFMGWSLVVAFFALAVDQFLFAGSFIMGLWRFLAGGL